MRQPFKKQARTANKFEKLIMDSEDFVGCVTRNLETQCNWKICWGNVIKER